jgi:hypothetical protein
MHREIQRVLREGFPTLFEIKDSYNGSRTVTEMGVGEGWAELLISAASVVVGHEEALRVPLDSRTQIREISEKYGELRVSFHQFADLFCYDVFSYAEWLSGSLCELCGYPGRIATSKFGWRKTLCTDCADARPYGQQWRLRPFSDAEQAQGCANVLQCELQQLQLTAKQEAAVLAYAEYLVGAFTKRDAFRERIGQDGPKINRISIVAPEGVPEFKTNFPADASEENIAAVALTQFFCAHTAWRTW